MTRNKLTPLVVGRNRELMNELLANIEKVQTVLTEARAEVANSAQRERIAREQANARADARKTERTS